MTINKKGLLLTLIACFALNSAVYAEEAKKEGKKDEKKEKTIAEMVKDKTMHDGLLDLYQDPKTGSMMMTISEEQLNKPFIYWVHTINGFLDAGHFKGSFRETKMVEFRKAFDKIEIIANTPRFYIDPESPLSRTEGTNSTDTILAAVKIEKHDEEKGTYLLKMDGVFLSETLHKVSPYNRPRMPGAPPAPPRFKLGKLSKDKTKYMAVRSYPKNTDVSVEYVFDNGNPSVFGGREVQDPRSTIVQMQHSFIETPDNNYQPRRDDSRLGFFMQTRNDLTTDDWAPYRDFINRWNLVKKNPDAAISEPVEPIVWWIENTTPHAWRDAIKRGVEAWNLAFEKAGFKNAMVVKVQPDDADWDAGDLRYNVLRWTTSPRPPFGGYGPSVANPLTGEIIASDIMLEFVFMKNRWLAETLYTDGSTEADMLPQMPEGGELYCSAGHFMHRELLAAKTMLASTGATFEQLKELSEQALIALILHEVGHTLGLNHNMMASQQYDHIQIHDKELTKGSITGSVMDYAPLNIAPPGVEQGYYSDIIPGAYDNWVIEYGYSPALADPEAEEKRLQEILARSTRPELAFGNDADDMRSPGRHIDPRIMTGDLSSNAIAYGEDRIKLVKETFGKLMDKTTEQGDSYQELVVGFNSLWGAYVGATNVASRYVGGIYIDRAVVGQKGATQPYTPVPKATQKVAMKLIADYLFAPNVLEEAQPYYNYLMRQRRGFQNYGRNEDPKLHDMLLNAQKRIMAHLLHPNVTKRMSDSALYGNEYQLNEFMADLTTAIFDADKRGDVTTKRQNLQTHYVKSLIGASGLKGKSRYDYLTQAAASYQLRDILDNYTSSRGNTSTKAHRSQLKWLIEDALDVE
jgi:hypothetical protein